MRTENVKHVFRQAGAKLSPLKGARVQSIKVYEEKAKNVLMQYLFTQITFYPFI